MPAPSRRDAKEGTPAGQGGIEAQEGGIETRDRGRAVGKGVADVRKRAGADKARRVLQGAEIEAAAGLHDHERQAAQRRLKRNRRGIGGPDDDAGQKLRGDGAVGKDKAPRLVAQQLAQMFLHGKIGMRLDDDVEGVQKARAQAAGEQVGMSEGLVGKEACHNEKARARDGVRGGGRLAQVEIPEGFGFAKTVEQNYELMRNLENLTSAGRRILVGVSRKSMIYRKFGITPEEALPQTQVLHFAALQKGADILRVHDVAEAARTAAVFMELE